MCERENALDSEHGAEVGRDVGGLQACDLGQRCVPFADELKRGDDEEGSTGFDVGAVSERARGERGGARLVQLTATGPAVGGLELEEELRVMEVGERMFMGIVACRARVVVVGV